MADLGALATRPALTNVAPQKADLQGVQPKMSNRPGRIRVDFIRGKLSQAVAIGGLTLQAPIFALLPVIQGTSGQYVPLTINPTGDALDAATAPEIVWITSHTQGAVTVTVVRAKENTVAKAWGSGTDVVSSITALDIMQGY